MSDCCTPTHKRKFDFLLWGGLFVIGVFYFAHIVMNWFGAGALPVPTWLHHMAQSVYSLINTMWWGVAAGVVMVALVAVIPQEFVMHAMGRKGGLNGLIRATFAGVLLDLCNHGILMVGATLYKRGISSGQLVAFLIASPWNSFSLTLILVSLIGLKWTLSFVALSLLVALITGWIFEALESRGVLPSNPNTIEVPEGFEFWKEAKSRLAATQWRWGMILEMALHGVKESRMVVRWLLLGVIMASAIRTFVDAGVFQSYLGPSLTGLAVTVLAATVIEVCSEGSTPLAADILTRAGAPGNSFTFLMAGAATDYTEIMVIKDATKSWLFSLMLPVVSLPQVLVIGYLLNRFAL
ncbi:MAG: permease [bacterium]|nr:permease [bacterium]